MSDKYYLRSRGKVLGPFPLERLQVMKARGQLGRTHQVSTDRQSWTAAGSLSELFAGPPEAVTFEAADEDLLQELPATPASGGQAGGPTTPVAAWYYHVAGQQFGPVSATELRNLHSAGELGPNDMVWREGMESWLALQEVPELSTTASFRSQATNNAGTKRRRSATAVTSLCLGIAPWPLYGVGILAFAIATSSIKTERIDSEQLLSLVVGAGFFSLVLNFTWFILSVLAIIFGGIGMSSISQSEGRLLGHGMAVTGLVVGIVNLVLLFLWVPLAMVLRA